MFMNGTTGKTIQNETKQLIKLTVFRRWANVSIAFPPLERVYLYVSWKNIGLCIQNNKSPLLPDTCLIFSPHINISNNKGGLTFHHKWATIVGGKMKTINRC